MKQLTVLLVAIPAILACTSPPELWCDNPALAKECGAAAACEAFEGRAADAKVNLTLFYEALCPGCRQFIKTTLYPLVYKQLSSIANVELVPFGNARLSGGNVVCQHGPEECVLNTIHSCGLKHLAPRGFEWVHCLESAFPAQPPAALAKCAAQLKLSQAQEALIKQCASGPEGVALTMAAAKRTAEAAPDAHQWVPWVLAGNTSLQRAQGLFLLTSPVQTICHWYQGKGLPSVCQLLDQVPPVPIKKCFA